MAVVLHVPTAAWVAPVAQHFEELFGSRWIAYARDGSSRSNHVASKGSEEVASDLSRGRCVVGIAADLNTLPSTLVNVADLRLQISTPAPGIIRNAIGRFCGKSPKDGSDCDVLGLDISELVAAFRPGSSAEQIVDRLAATASTIRGGGRTDIPDLKTAFEYGKARAWGLNLARDISDYRAGRLTWADLPRGVVLYSEPGLGKSLYPHSLSSACGLPIITTSAADWFMSDQGYLNDVIRSMRSVFERAKAMAPCILFVDEIDSIPNRATLSSRNADFWKPLCNDILLWLDNAISDTRRGVIVIGATNNVSAIDPALTRPGRLEQTIEIERPDLAGALNILKYHSRGDIPESDLAEIAFLAERSTGAEIMLAVREARRLARHANVALSADHLRTVLLPMDDIAPHMLWRVCVHEAGHAISSLAVKSGRLQRCVVRIKDGASGHTLIEPDTEYALTRKAIEDRAVVLLSGRAAEHVLMESESIGAGGKETSDLAQATELMSSLQASSGMGATLTYLASPTEALGAIRINTDLRKLVEADLQKLQARARGLMVQYRPVVFEVAQALRKSRHLSGAAVRQIFENRPIKSIEAAEPCRS